MMNILLFLLPVSLSLGLQVRTGTIRGTITNAETKDPVSGVSVSIKKLRLETKSDPHGEFVFKNIPEGTYDFEISTPDFVTMRFKGFAVRSDSTLTLNIPLTKIVYKPRIRIFTPDSTIDYKMRYVPIPKQNGQKPN